MTFELDKWPIIRAKNYKDVASRTIRLVVIHDMEAPEGAETAENVAKYFASGKVQASAHLCIDSNSIVRGVDDVDVAYAAPGANSDGIQMELAGYARQTRADWLDAYSKATIENTAKATAQYCVKYGIPVKHLTNKELSAGQKGIVGHAQVSSVYKKSSHTDPGGNFPWDYFLQRVSYWFPYYANNRAWPKQKQEPVAPKPTPVATKTGGKRMLVQFAEDNHVYEVVGSTLVHVTKDAWMARGLKSADVTKLPKDHALSKLPRKNEY